MGGVTYMPKAWTFPIGAPWLLGPRLLRDVNSELFWCVEKIVRQKKFIVLSTPFWPTVEP